MCARLIPPISPVCKPRVHTLARTHAHMHVHNPTCMCAHDSTFANISGSKQVRAHMLTPSMCHVPTPTRVPGRALRSGPGGAVHPGIPARRCPHVRTCMRAREHARTDAPPRRTRTRHGDLEGNNHSYRKITFHAYLHCMHT